MPRRHPQASGAARLISDRLARRCGSSVLLIEQACQLDVHEPSTDSEARPRRHLDAPFRQLQCGGVYAHPHARLLAPEVLYEFVHADSLRGWIWGSRLKFQDRWAALPAAPLERGVFLSLLTFVAARNIPTR